MPSCKNGLTCQFYTQGPWRTHPEDPYAANMVPGTEFFGNCLDVKPDCGKPGKACCPNPYHTSARSIGGGWAAGARQAAALRPRRRTAAVLLTLCTHSSPCALHPRLQPPAAGLHVLGLQGVQQRLLLQLRAECATPGPAGPRPLAGMAACVDATLRARICVPPHAFISLLRALAPAPSPAPQQRSACPTPQTAARSGPPAASATAAPRPTCSACPSGAPATSAHAARCRCARSAPRTGAPGWTPRPMSTHPARAAEAELAPHGMACALCRLPAFASTHSSVLV
jgi:hypothetical protein